MGALIDNINLLLVFAILFQAFIFMMIFLMEKGGHAIRLLGIYELSYFITYLIVFLYYIELYNAYIVTSALLYPLYAWLSIIFYFFIKKLSRGELSKRDWLHVIFPLILLLANVVIMLLVSYDSRFSILIDNQLPLNATGLDIFFFNLNHTIYQILLVIQALIYVGLDIFELLRLRKKIREEFSYEEGINLKWATEILIIFTSFFIISLFIYNDTFTFAYLLFIGILIGINSVNYLLKHYKTFAEASKDITKKEKESAKYLYSALSPREKEILFDKLKQYIAKDKIFINPDLRLTDIAAKLKSNRQYISQIINEQTGSNFYHFINRFRIEEFVSLYQKGEFKNLSIERLAYKVGFKSKSSFYTAFKKEKGLSPGEFINKKTC